ncbi:MAG: cation transporter [Solobacterium sp.]|nr:cation transporter [Solobacterium sp.]
MSEQNELVSRSREIVRASIVGIGVNVLLAGLKAVIGLLTHSIAVILDAVNNLSDALSSLITIIGTRLAGKKPDKEHPLGYGRIEYLSALIISAIVLYAGITAFTESVKKIIQPETPQYTTVSLLLLAAAVGAKIFLGTYMKKVGARVNSGSLIASGSDALNDAVISTSVIVSAIIYLVTGLKLEAIVGAVIAVMIIKSGFELIRDTLDDILGKRPDAELSKAVKATVASRPEVMGAYDLIINSYGPDTAVASVHIEVPDTMTAKELDDLERKIAADVFEKHHIVMGGISVYSVNTSGDAAAKLRDDITRMVASHDGVLQIHGFYVDEATKQISFDVVLDYASDRKALYQEILNEVSAAYPDYTFTVQLDNDLSD